MARKSRLSYSGAVSLLDGQAQPFARGVEALVGAGILLGATVFPPALGLLDAKKEAFEQFSRLYEWFGRRLRGSTGRSRQELISAAHTTIVLSSLFDSFAAILGPAFASLELSDEEKLRIVTGKDNAPAQQGWIDQLLAAEFPLPAAHRGFEDNVRWELRPRILRLAETAIVFFEGLSAWDAVAPRMGSLKTDAAERALAYYRERYVQLSAEVHEFFIWAVLGEQSATTGKLRQVNAQLASICSSQSEALGKLHDLLATTVPEKKPSRSSHRAKLARAAASVLSKPILRSSSSPLGVVLPAVADAFVTPRFRYTVAGPATEASKESWWSEQPVQNGLDEFLAAYLSHAEATASPLLVLGHPGAGKSLLTEVLAARLPTQGYVVLPVQLRRVHAEDRVLDQVEAAMRDILHDNVSWGALADESPDLVRVIILDGFDELIQATGVVQSSYLKEVQRFQQQEADLGRSVSVIVTSRTVVMDRALIPDDSVIVKLEDFSDAQIAQWLNVWNRANQASSGFRPLRAQSLLVYAALARQPLLLLMLALYAADSRIDQLGKELSSAALYERLLDNFIRRQVEKSEHEYSESDLTRQLAEHRWRLSIAAFAMFNRGRQQISEEDLDRDLEALLGRPEKQVGTSFGAQVTRAHRTVADFFFVHVASVNDHIDLGPRRTYEFLHATFGEFLIAEMTLKLLYGYARQQQTHVADPAFQQGPDDSMLRAFLSSQPLTTRRAIVEFARQIIQQTPTVQREELLIALRHLLEHARAKARGRYDRYEPSPFDVVTAVASYTVNLVILAVLITGNPDAVVTAYPSNWDTLVRLWQAAFDDDAYQALLEIMPPF